MYYPRFYQLENFLKAGKVLVIYGSRQVGKTTLVNHFLSQTSLKYRLDSGDNIRIQQLLGSQDFSQVLSYVSGYELIVIDEAQRIPHVGQGLKIIVDQAPQIKLIATGSSSFSLAGQIGEPLTGRKTTLILFPLSQLELGQLLNDFDLKQKLAEYLIFGSYPEVLTAAVYDKKAEILNELVNSYLLKDILELERVKSSKTLLDLLRLIAFQVGNEVSLSELGEKLGLDYKTVSRYLDLLEKSFVIFNVRGFSRNLRTEITKKSKYYFYDNGVRNAIIANFNGLELRDDIGKLWENFLIAERLKLQHYRKIYVNNYFWRTWQQQEIDWLEEREGQLFAYEFKYAPKKIKTPTTFKTAYPNSHFQVISQDNYLKFIKT